MKLSIRQKLTLFFILLITIIILLFDIIVYHSFKKSLENNIDTTLINEINSIMTELFKRPSFKKKLAEGEINYKNYKSEDLKEESERKPILTKFLESVEDIYLPNNHIGQLIKVDDKNKLIYRTPNYPNIKIPLTSSLSKKSSAIKSGSFCIDNYKNVRIMNYYVDYKKDKYLVQIAIPLAKIKKPLLRIKSILVFSTPFLILLLSFIAFLFIKRAFYPVKKIVSQVNRISAKDLSKRIKPIGSNDEIGELIDTFNNLFNRLEDSFEHVKRFSIDVSHELKTPLTVLKGEIEVALRKNRDSSEYISILKSLDEEVGKMQNIVKNMFLLSSLESDKVNLKLVEVDLSDVLTETFDALYKLAKDKKQNIEMRNVTSEIILGDKELLVRLFSNLLENAIKYTQVNGKIIIEMKKSKTNLQVAIIDNGSGINEENQKKIFDRFFRVDKSRNSETGGVGLGLAIANKIAQLHNAVIKVESEPNKGSTFFVIFAV